MQDNNNPQEENPVVVQPRDLTAGVQDAGSDGQVSDVDVASEQAQGGLGEPEASEASETSEAQGIGGDEPEPSVPAMPAAMGQTEAPIVDAVEMNREQKILDAADNSEAIKAVREKIEGAENILVALSADPSVDDIAAAMGLALALDKMGKHATAIYSGETPNVLEFLEPHKTLEENADSLQDLIIALNKDKADHLRYKVDGDYVKIFVTPYKTKLSADDLEFSYGDYNVDLVIALNVQAAISLDNVLREHGRIMHDASAINITTGAPGRFGELEWSNPDMSSVSEMVTNLLLALKADIDATIATSLLAGIVGATERFKNKRTMPETMKISGRLMEFGADAQLVAENIRLDGEVESNAPDDLEIEVSHDAPQLEVPEEIVPEEPEPIPVMPAGPVDAPLLNAELMEELRRQQEEANRPPEEPEDDGTPDYGKMIDEALAEVNAGMMQVPAEPQPEVSVPVAEVPAAEPMIPPVVEAPVVETQPVERVSLEPTMEAPVEVATEPMTETAMPDLPMPDDTILPPPPTPEVDFSKMPEMPAVGGDVQSQDPGQFKIPGM